MAPHGQWVGEDQMRNSRRRSKAKYDQVIQKALDPKQLAAIHTRCLEVIESHICVCVCIMLKESLVYVCVCVCVYRTFCSVVSTGKNDTVQ